MNFCDLICDWFAVTLFMIPYCFCCRALLYIGSWFKQEAAIDSLKEK